MITKKGVGSVLAAAFAVALAACGSDVPVTESKTGDAVKKVEQASKEDLDTYIEGFASGDPSEMEEGKAITSPGSIAEAYMTHQIAIANSHLDGGEGTSEDKVSKVGDGYKLCSPGATEKECATYTDFKSAEGKLSSFTINGLDLTERLAVGEGDPIKAGKLATAKFVSSYQSATNNLFVTFEIESSSQKLNLGIYESKYRAPDGRQSTATAGSGPTELGADSKANITVAFEKAKPGGEVTLTISDENYNDQKTIKVKTR